MYHNVSRGASPSAAASRSRKIDLENIEEYQDAWCRKNEMLRDPPPPPQLNSPRSLRACAMSDVDPQHILQKLSLKQHLFRVLGNANMLGALPKPATAEYRVLMQSALRSFQEATVGLGTSQEKLAAYIAFTHQEELRVAHLTSLREVRRQLVAEEVFEERKRHHHRHRTADTAVSDRSSASATRRGSSAHSRGSGRRTDPNASSQLWSSKVEESARSRHASVSSQQDASLQLSGHLVSPVSAGLSSRGRHKTPPLHRHSNASAVAAAAGDSQLSDAVVGFTPTASPSGKLPYTPRDVSSLNSSYFANRSIQSTVSNPSGATLPSPPAKTTTAVVSPAPRRPALAQKSAQPHQRQLLPPPPSRNLHTALSDSATEADHEVSLDAGQQSQQQDNSGIDAVPKQDLSVVSLNSNQLELLLNPPTAQRSPAVPVEAVTSGEAVRQARSQESTSTNHAVQLFHDSEPAAKTEPAAISAASEGQKKPAPQPATTVPVLNLAESAPAEAAAAAALVVSAPPSATSSLPITPRGRNGYTNHLKSPRQRLTSAYPRPTTSASVSVSDQSSVREDERKAEEPSPEQRETSAAKTPSNGSTARSWSSAAQPLIPPAITPAEQEDGFVYYCANPTRSVTKFYGGARFPIVSAVKL